MAAQNPQSKKEVTKTIDQEQINVEAPASNEPERVYTMAMVDDKPMFPGGDDAMYTWINQNIHYPATAAEDAVQGRVVVEFEIAPDGTIDKAKIVRGRHPDLDRESLRLIKSMPRWIPGRVNGRPVRVVYTLPVTFKLQ